MHISQCEWKKTGPNKFEKMINRGVGITSGGEAKRIKKLVGSNWYGSSPIPLKSLLRLPIWLSSFSSKLLSDSCSEYLLLNMFFRLLRTYFFLLYFTLSYLLLFFYKTQHRQIWRQSKDFVYKRPSLGIVYKIIKHILKRKSTQLY